MVGGDTLFEGIEQFCALPVQGDLHDGAQAMPEHRCQFVDRQDSDLAFDQARIAQPFDPSQAGGRRRMRALRQFQIAEACVLLQGVHETQVDVIYFE